MTRMKQHLVPATPVAPTGITVIIVGLGVAGLTAAIECHRKGHTVIGFEKAPKSRQIGRLISRISIWTSSDPANG